ncbi:MAG: hypothetical protein JWN53_702 [Gemmatimonadetes bacterium]|jgi:hypothetical protein|nr:hypothetical protein [Gemmatimonadota bacterium]
MRPSSVRSHLLAVVSAALVLAAPLQGQESTLFTWTGRVDRRVDITAQGSNVTSAAVRGQEYNGRFRVNSALPQQDGIVRVVMSGGRGEASVIEQPNANNNYRTVIRVVDRSSGADRYQLTAYYTPTSNMNDPRRGRGGYGRGGGGNPNLAPAVLHWSGDVDADAEVRWQGSNVTQRALNANALRAVRSSITSLSGRDANQGRYQGPNQAGTATVAVRSGRGSVDVVEQPNQNNNWTTVIRIRDPQSGYGRYSFDVTRQ